MINKMHKKRNIKYIYLKKSCSQCHFIFYNNIHNYFKDLSDDFSYTLYINLIMSKEYERLSKIKKKLRIS